MDIGSLFGFLGVWALVIWAVASGGHLGLFWNAPSCILVVGGSLAILVFAFPFDYIRRMFTVAGKAFVEPPLRIEQIIEDLVAYAEIARRDGILSLEQATKHIDDPFVVRGIQMAVDGTDPELIEQIMNDELDNLVERHNTGKALFEALGRYAPALGMVGTLVGLVIMLQNMQTPDKIGPGMAVAILTTLYGALIAYAICGPIADRLSRRSSEEVLYRTVIIKGVMAIQRGDNPRIVEQKLRTFLPPHMRRNERLQKAA